jgi:hypothetical protein
LKAAKKVSVILKESPEASKNTKFISDPLPKYAPPMVEWNYDAKLRQKVECNVTLKYPDPDTNVVETNTLAEDDSCQNDLHNRSNQ